MPAVFMDSFGHYAVNNKWSSAGSSQINIPVAYARTNTGVLQIVGGVFGPQFLFPSNLTNVIGQVAVNANTPGATQNPTVMEFVAPGQYNIAVRINGDGSVAIWRGNGDTAEVQLATSTNRPYIWNTWNTFECTCFFSATVGTVVLKVNGQQCINISGIRTVSFAANQFCSAFQLLGPGTGLWYMADCVVLDWSSAPNNTPIAQAKVYVVTPFENGNPVNWIPLAGSNFSEVNQIPPPGDTSYNSSGNIGDVDQYHVNPTGVPGAAVIQALQHNMDLRVDSGARTVASVIGGVVGSAQALTTSYVIYPFPQDSIPAFPVGVGPKVTA
jgi:hypothetical protein